jgi:hypothetical protein
MSGTDRVRFCGICRKSVYDLSRMTQHEVEDLLQQDPDHCVRLFRREDGTVMTRRGDPTPPAVGVSDPRRREGPVAETQAEVGAAKDLYPRF